MGWDPVLHDWQISQKLRKMIINVNWVKDGKLLFKSNNFAGYIGIYNGLKPNMFSITADDRFQLIGGYYGILKWVFGLEADGKWMSWLARETLEQKNCEFVKSSRGSESHYCSLPRGEGASDEHSDALPSLLHPRRIQEGRRMHHRQKSQRNCHSVRDVGFATRMVFVGDQLRSGI